MRSLLAAAVVAALAALAATPVSAAPGEVPRDVRLSGRAGDVATFRLDRTTRLGTRGAGVTVTAPGATWSGVAVTRLDSPPSSDGMDTYVHYRLHDRLLCPGELCEPDKGFQPYVGTADDGRGYGVLRPGVYGLALLGPHGARVSAALHLVGPRKGTATLRAGKAAAYQTALFDPAVAAPGAELASRGFAQVATRRRHVVDSLAIGFVLARPAAIEYAICATDGARRLDGARDAAPCADGHVNGPEVQAVPSVEAGRKRVGIAWAVTAGRARDMSGLGYEAQIAGVDGRIVALHFAVAF